VHELAGASVEARIAHGDRMVPYDCGAALSWLTDTAVRRQDMDIFGFWRGLLAQSTGYYNMGDYLTVLGEITDDHRLVSQIYDLAASGPGDSGQWQQAFLQQGLRIEPAGRTPVPASEDLMQSVAALAQADCGVPVKIERAGSNFRIAGRPQCRNLKREVVLQQVGGQPMSDVGAALGALHNACTTRGAIDVQVAPGPTALSLSCSNWPGPPRAYRQVPLQ